MGHFEFVNPEFFWLLLLLPLVLLWQIFTWRNKQAAVRLSSIKSVENNSGQWLVKLQSILVLLRIAAITAIILAITRPRVVDTSTRSRNIEGIDIIMAIDVSASMLARDLRPNRLEALKQVASQFIQNRPNDRIGLVVYAGESYTKAPLTIDKDILLKAIHDIDFGQIKDGTAIGLGLATSINRVKNSDAKSKVIILLTDGENNTGFIDPMTASEMAKSLGIRVYTIGIGTNGMAMSPVSINPDGSYRFANIQVVIDEELMMEIAKETGGKYYRATSLDKLEEIYHEIDQLETTEIEETEYAHYDEKFRIFLLIGFGLLTLKYILRYTIFRSFI